MFIYFFERENMGGGVGRAERKREREPEACSALTAESYVGLEPMNGEIMTRAEVSRLTN